MAKLAVNVQGTTRTPPRISNSNSGSNVNHDAVIRAEFIAAALFVLLIALHTTGKIGD